jgi:hypothetical protein
MMIVSWNTTNKCNTYCSHCYRDSGKEHNEELTTEEGKKLIEEIVKAGFKMMIFSGGEPLMRKDIFELIQYSSSLGLIPVLGSNGTLINLNIAKKLKKAGTKSIGISLDSLNGKKHDRFRRYKNAWKDTVQEGEDSLHIKSESVLMIIGTLFIAANLRVPLTTAGPLVAGPLVKLICSSLYISNTLAGMITTIPLFAFVIHLLHLNGRVNLELIQCCLFQLLLLQSGIYYAHGQIVLAYSLVQRL